MAKGTLGIQHRRASNFEAKITLTPCMNLEDLQKGFEELSGHRGRAMTIGMFTAQP